jgi:hypothetical protein
MKPRACCVRFAHNLTGKAPELLTGYDAGALQLIAYLETVRPMLRPGNGRSNARCQNCGRE